MEIIDWTFAEQICNLIDNYTVYKISLIRKVFIEKILNRKAHDTSEKKIRIISQKIRKINTELLNLNLIEKYGSLSYKNITKKNLFSEFDRRMKDEYIIWGIKK